MTNMPAFELNKQAEAARSLLANIRDILADDEQAIADAIEGETGLLEAIGSAVARIGEIAAIRDGIDAYAKQLKARLARLDRQEELIRTALLSAVSATGLKKIELPIATVSLKAVPPSLVVTCEADIPPEFWKPQDPKMDRKAVTDALKAKQAVPGAELSNGGETIAIKLG